MTQRTSLVGGVLSFAAVIFLTFLCEGIGENGSLLRQRSVPVPGDSVGASEDRDTVGPGEVAPKPSMQDQGQGTFKAPDGIVPILSPQSDNLDGPTTMIRTPTRGGTLWVIEPNEVDNEGTHPLEGLEAP